MPALVNIPVLLTGRGGLLTRYVLNALNRSGRQVYSLESAETESRRTGGRSSPRLRPVASSRSDSAPTSVAELWHVVGPEAGGDTTVLDYLRGRAVADAQALGAHRIVIVLCGITLALLGHASSEEFKAEVASGCADEGIACSFVSVDPFLESPGSRAWQLESSASLLIRVLLAETGAFPDESPASEFAGSYLRFLSWEELEAGLARAASDTAFSSISLRGNEVVTVDNLVAILRNLLNHTKSPLDLPEPVESSIMTATLEFATAPSPGIEATKYKGAVQVDDVANESARVVRSASGDSALATFVTQILTSSDDFPLRVYSRRVGKPALVFVNAYGMPADLLVPLARTLPEMDFYTWESRYVPVVDDRFDPESTNIGCHCGDLLDVLDYFGLDEVHLAGWCTGAQVCLRFAHDHPERVKSLSLINGAFALESLKAVDFHQSILGLLERAASGVQAAAMTQKLAYGDKALQALAEFDGSPDGGGIPQQNDPHLAQMLSQLFCTPETLHRYATMAVGLWDEPGHAWTTDTSAPTLVLTSPRDIMSPPHTSSEIATMLGDCARLAELDDGDHYILYNRYRDVGDTLRGFIQSIQDWNGKNE